MSRQPNCLRRFRGRRKAQLPQRFAHRAWGVRSRNDTPDRSPNSVFSPKLGAWPIYSTSFFGNQFSALASFSNQNVGIPFDVVRLDRDSEPIDTLSSRCCEADQVRPRLRLRRTPSLSTLDRSLRQLGEKPVRPRDSGVALAACRTEFTSCIVRAGRRPRSRRLARLLRSSATPR